MSVLNFTLYFFEALLRLYVASVNHAIQSHRVVVQLNELVVLQIQLGGHIGREDHRHRVVKVRFDCLLQTLQVKWVSDKILIYLHKDVVVFKVAEPADPALGLGLFLEDW